MPIVAKRIAQGGVRLGMILNRVFGHHNQDTLRPTWPTWTILVDNLIQNIMQTIASNIYRVRIATLFMNKLLYK